MNKYENHVRKEKENIYGESGALQMTVIKITKILTATGGRLLLQEKSATDAQQDELKKGATRETPDARTA